MLHPIFNTSTSDLCLKTRIAILPCKVLHGRKAMFCAALTTSRPMYSFIVSIGVQGRRVSFSIRQKILHDSYHLLLPCGWMTTPPHGTYLLYEVECAAPLYLLQVCLQVSTPSDMLSKANLSTSDAIRPGTATPTSLYHSSKW